MSDPRVELVEQSGETTLLIDGGQAMQAWERDLMRRSADLLCEYGCDFLEVGLGLGISALHIAGNPRTRTHVVIEKYAQVIDFFRQRHPALPPTLDIVHADLFEYAYRLEPESLDGIFFDPFLIKPDADDYDKLWMSVLPRFVASLRVGGAMMPFFMTRPELRSPFCYYFDRIIVERHRYETYPGTVYTPSASGDAFIQCFVKTRG